MVIFVCAYVAIPYFVYQIFSYYIVIIIILTTTGICYIKYFKRVVC